MSKQTINIGASPNDGTGTPLRTSFDYTNQNFTELYTALGGGVGLPGATTQVIFNDGGTNLAGDAGLVYNKTTDALTVAGLVTAGSATITGDLTVRTNKLAVTSTGVGCGTASPSEPLHVNKSSGTGTFIRLQDSANSNYIGTDNGNFRVLNGASPVYDLLKIEQLGVFTFGDGAGGTRMTLNSTGLGIGVAPTDKLTLQSATDCALSLAKTSGTDKLYIITDGTTGWLASTAGATGKKIAYSLTCPDNSLTLDASGRLLVGKAASALGTVGIESAAGGFIQSTVTSDASLFCNRLATDGETIKFYRQTLQVGNISVTTTATAYNTSSDYRLKEDAQPLVGGLARVNALKPSIYKWKVNGSTGEGFMAHELADVVPFAVTGEKDAVDADNKPTYQGVDLSKIVPILVAAIQELTARVQTLEAR